jgi:hypothetical protein
MLVYFYTGGCNAGLPDAITAVDDGGIDASGMTGTGGGGGASSLAFVFSLGLFNNVHCRFNSPGAMSQCGFITTHK